MQACFAELSYTCIFPELSEKMYDDLGRTILSSDALRAFARDVRSFYTDFSSILTYLHFDS